MKLAPQIAVIILAVASATSLTTLRAQEDAVSQPKLTVHEWGTFTVLEGSDGNVIQWYQSPANLTDLPSFVQRKISVGGKSGTGQIGWMDTVRMETPVLYFYPEREMEVSVTAGFPNGRITEVFPPAVTTANGESYWKGHLLPPNSPELANIPGASDKAGRHYGAARNVPEAWLFRNGSVQPVENRKLIESFNAPSSTAKDQPAAAKVEPIDHFIFYRGAGNPGGFQIRVEASSEPGAFVVSNFDKSTIPHLLALRVVNGQTSWVTMTNLEQWKIDEHSKRPINQQKLQFPTATTPTPEAVPALRDTMITGLTKEGLTPAEAAAMVATWDDLWFTEPGIRVLAVLPQSVADAMVPLKISPPPTQLDRVFVARVEIITRGQEQAMMNLLIAPTEADDASRKTLADQHLGRFAAGGMERAITLMNAKMRQQFGRLEKAVAR